MVVILPIRAAEQGGPHAGDRFDLIVAGVQIGDDLVGGQAVEMGMIVGMAHDLVSRIMEGLHRLRIFVHPLSHHKEGGLHIVFRHDVDELLGILISPG